MECFDLNQGDSQCEMEMEVSTGALKVLNRKIKLWEADKTLTETLKTNFLDFDSQKNIMKFSIAGDQARLIFENLSDEKKVQSIVLASDDLYAEGLEKKGVNIDCYQQFLKANPKDGIYTCNFWYKDSTIGEFH